MTNANIIRKNKYPNGSGILEDNYFAAKVFLVVFTLTSVIPFICCLMYVDYSFLCFAFGCGCLIVSIRAFVFILNNRKIIINKRWLDNNPDTIRPCYGI